jgi:hypothetical protein
VDAAGPDIDAVHGEPEGTSPLPLQSPFTPSAALRGEQGVHECHQQ